MRGAAVVLLLALSRDPPLSGTATLTHGSAVTLFKVPVLSGQRGGGVFDVLVSCEGEATQEKLRAMGVYEWRHQGAPPCRVALTTPEPQRPSAIALSAACSVENSKATVWITARCSLKHKTLRAIYDARPRATAP